MKPIFFLLLLCLFFSCREKDNSPTELPWVQLYQSKHLLVEHSSFRQLDSDSNLKKICKDSSFYSSLNEVSVFQQSAKNKMANYLIDHLKGVNSLRLLGVTHHYFYDVDKGSYYIQYYKNKNKEKIWGCKLNHADGSLRLSYQNITALKDKDFGLNYNVGNPISTAKRP